MTLPSTDGSNLLAIVIATANKGVCRGEKYSSMNGDAMRLVFLLLRMMEKSLVLTVFVIIISMLHRFYTKSLW